MEAAAGANGGICVSFSTMGFGLGFNNPKFSDRVLKIQVADDTVEPKAGKCTRSKAEESQDSKGSPSISALSFKVTTVHINSLILGFQSSFFYKMFSNGMKESEQQTITIQVQASEELALLDLLEFLYTHKLKANTPAELMEVLVLADRYQVAACVTFCAQALSSFPMTFELALSCLALPSTIPEGNNTHLSSLIDATKCFLSKNFSLHSREALELPLESVEEILSWDTLEVDSEDEVYDFLLDWLRTRYIDLGERCEVYSLRLCQLVRFQHMSCEKLKVVLHNEELDQGDANKMVVEALFSKFKNHPTDADATSPRHGRVYKLLPVDVIVPDIPHEECIVYTRVKKEDCISVIRTQKFHFANESFYLQFEPDMNGESLPRLFQLFLVRSASKSLTGDLKFDIEFAVRLKTTGKFTAELTGSCTLKEENCGARLVRPLDLGPYFDNGVLYIRVTLSNYFDRFVNAFNLT